MQTLRQLTIDTVRQQIAGIDTQVPLLDGTHRPYTNFDNAASTPVLMPVQDKIGEFVNWYSSVHRGAGFKSRVATHAYEEAHDIVCRFVGANPATHTVIFGKNSTEALNKVAHRLPIGADEVILVSAMEHHSNMLPWRGAGQVEYIRLDARGALDEAHFDSLLRTFAGRVRLVAVTGASNVTGYINPIQRLAEKAHAAGTEILVDAAQLAPHRPVDVGALDDPAHIDYLVLSAHKMYAPYGTGALVAKKDIFLDGAPDLVGGGTVDVVTLDRAVWAGLPDREEAGSPNVIGAVALAKAILCLQDIGMAALAAHERDLTGYLLERLAAMPGVKVFGITDPAQAAHKTGVVPFSVEGVNHMLVAAILSAEGGIGVRNGSFCAQPYIRHLLGLGQDQTEIHCDDITQIQAQMPGLVRVSFGCYNTRAEIDWLCEVLQSILRRRYKGVYEFDAATASYAPRGYAPRPTAYFDWH